MVEAISLPAVIWTLQGNNLLGFPRLNILLERKRLALESRVIQLVFGVFYSVFAPTFDKLVPDITGDKLQFIFNHNIAIDAVFHQLRARNRDGPAGVNFVGFSPAFFRKRLWRSVIGPDNSILVIGTRQMNNL